MTTDKKAKRSVAMPRLYKSIDEMVDRTPELTDASTVAELLDAVKDVWFKEAQK